MWMSSKARDHKPVKMNAKMEMVREGSGKFAQGTLGMTR